LVAVAAWAFVLAMVAIATVDSAIRDRLDTFRPRVRNWRY
jgi:hypothetical protein